jgi:hypothetical protein
MSDPRSPFPLTDDSAAEAAVPAVEPPAGSPDGGSTAGGPGEERGPMTGGAAGAEVDDGSGAGAA